MLSLVAVAILTGAFLVQWRRSRLPLDEFSGLAAAKAYACVWHRCRTNRPAPFPATGPGIVVSNHTCSPDPTFIHSAGKRIIGYLTAREHYRVAVGFRWFLNWMRCIPLTRNCNDVGAIRRALRQLGEGGMIGIFPEGNLSGAVGDRLRVGKAGVALLALHSQAPVFPVYIAGGPRTEKLLLGWLRPSRVPVRVYYGRPVDLSDYYGRPITRRLLEEVTGLIMRHVAALRPRRRGEPNPLVEKERGEHDGYPGKRAEPKTLCAV
jgi:1-acyl-sn-glycerol-3-phosphate acyltransferase